MLRAAGPGQALHMAGSPRPAPVSEAHPAALALGVLWPRLQLLAHVHHKDVRHAAPLVGVVQPGLLLALEAELADLRMRRSHQGGEGEGARSGGEWAPSRGCTAEKGALRARGLQRGRPGQVLALAPRAEQPPWLRAFCWVAMGALLTAVDPAEAALGAGVPTSMAPLTPASSTVSRLAAASTVSSSSQPPCKLGERWVRMCVCVMCVCVCVCVRARVRVRVRVCV